MDIKYFRVIPLEVRKDILWWHRFLNEYNGVSILLMEEWSSPDEIFSSDACLTGCGALCSDQFFHMQFPEFITKNHLNINCLELFSVVLAVGDIDFLGRE